jgi:hypothetical protein
LRELPSTEWLLEFQKKLHAKAKGEPKFRFYGEGERYISADTHDGLISHRAAALDPVQAPPL